MNLARQNYFFDEDAFTLLNKYLSRLKIRFQDMQGAEDMILDIETRITEIIQDQKHYENQVVSLDEVESIIAQLGPIEEYGDTTEEASSPQSSTMDYDHEAQFKKKLYKDPENKIISGVCAGICKYVGWKDPLWLRLGLVLTVVFADDINLDGLGGMLVIAYFVLAVLLPKATNRLDRLKMKGKPVTVQEIEKNYQAEYLASSTKVESDRVSTGLGRLSDFLGEIGAVLGKAILWISKYTMIFIGLVLTFCLMVFFWALSSMKNSGLSFTEFAGQGNEWYVHLTYYSLLLLVAIPIIAIIVYVLKELFKLKMDTHWFRSGSIIVWILSLFTLLIGSSRIASLFSAQAKTEERQSLYATNSDTLYLNYERSAYEGDMNINMGSFKLSGGEVTYEDVKFNIEQSLNDSMYIIVKKKSRGKNKQDAYANAEEIHYKFIQNDTLLTIKPGFTVDHPMKFRNQSVEVVLMLPVGKTVFLKENMEDVIYDIKNTTSTWDGNMTNKYWVMTNQGLSNPELEKEEAEHPNHSDSKKDKDTNVVYINDKKVKIIKDGDDITISTKDEKDTTTTK